MSWLAQGIELKSCGHHLGEPPCLMLPVHCWFGGCLCLWTGELDLLVVMWGDAYGNRVGPCSWWTNHIRVWVETIDVEVRRRCAWLWWSLAWVCRQLWCQTCIGVGDRRTTPWWGGLWRLKDLGGQPDLGWWKICYYRNRRELPAGYWELWLRSCKRENLRMWMLVYAGVVLPSTPRDSVFRQVGSVTVVS